MGKTLFYSAILLLSLVGSSSALTLTTDEHYYLVAPKHENDIDNAIMLASPMGSSNNDPHTAFRKNIGQHQARYSTPGYSLSYNDKICFIDKINISLDSRIYLPKIDRDGKQYSDRTLTQFKIVADEILVHEKKHRQIYVQELQSLLNYFRGINQANTKFTTCNDLQQHIQTRFQRTEKSIQQQNLDFDCFEYGKEMNLDMCKNTTISGKKMEAAPMSSISQGGKSDVKSYKKDEKPDDQECDGKLIEPFKGKFYCVPADSYTDS